MRRPELPDTIGRYEVLDRLGHGGMGVVVRGRDPRIGRLVAIKLLTVGDDRMRERFLREAQSAGNLKHRNIVTIFDIGEQDGQSFIVMEYVEGVTLAGHIRHHALPLWRKLEIMDELLAGLDYAHEKGIVHRDVKPANVMTDRDGVVKILDFGMARVPDSGITQAGTMLGTPNYMSPELVEGKPADRRSDIFSVGALFYELLTNHRPFAAKTIWEVINAVARKSPIPVTTLCPEIDPSLETIVNRALEKNPARRYQTLAAMNADLALARSRMPGRPAVAQPGSITVLTPPPMVAPGERPALPESDRALISRRRAERIDGHLREARQAFDDGDYVAAREACEQALLLDADDVRVLALVDQIRRAVDRRESAHLVNDARVYLDRDELDEAAQLLDRAGRMDPDSEAIRELQEALDARVRERDAERQRHEEVEQLLAAARTSLADADAESAIEHASDALAIDPGNEGAGDVIRQARAIIDQRERAAEAERRAAADAVAHAAAKREEEIAAHLVRASTQLVAGDLTGARTAAEAALAVDPQHAGAVSLLAEINRLIEADGFLRAAVEHRRAVERLKTQAEHALSANDFAGALHALDEALAIEPETTDRQTLRAKAQGGLRATRGQTEPERRAREAKADAWRHAESDDRLRHDQEATEQQAAEARARERRIEEQRRLARDEIGAGQFAQALARLQQLARAESPVEGLDALIDQALAGQAATDARRRAAAAAAARAAADRTADPDPSLFIRVPAAAVPQEAPPLPPSRSNAMLWVAIAVVAAIVVVYLMMR
jgi:protein kinase-like protein